MLQSNNNYFYIIYFLILNLKLNLISIFFMLKNKIFNNKNKIYL